MTVSSIVRELAEGVIATGKVCSARQRLQLELFRMMPVYREVGILGSWDRAFNDTWSKERDTSEMGHLIAVLYGFATVNFYGAFQADVTIREYESTSRCFRTGGITCPAVDKFDDDEFA
jgi:hypothetical protein